MCQVSVEVELAVMRVPGPLCKNALLERMQCFIQRRRPSRWTLAVQSSTFRSQAQDDMTRTSESTLAARLSHGNRYSAARVNMRLRSGDVYAAIPSARPRTGTRQ